MSVAHPAAAAEPDHDPVISSPLKGGTDVAGQASSVGGSSTSASGASGASLPGAMAEADTDPVGEANVDIKGGLVATGAVAQDTLGGTIDVGQGGNGAAGGEGSIVTKRMVTVVATTERVGAGGGVSESQAMSPQHGDFSRGESLRSVMSDRESVGGFSTFSMATTTYGNDDDRDVAGRRARRRHDAMVREHAKLTNDVARIKRVLEPEDNPGDEEIEERRLEVRMWLDEMRLKELDAVVSKAFSKLSKLQGENQELRAQQAESADPKELARSIESLTQQIQELKVENRRLLKERKLEARSEDAQLTSEYKSMLEKLTMEVQMARNDYQAAMVMEKAKLARHTVRQQKLRALQEESLELAAVVRQCRDRRAASNRRQPVSQEERNMKEQLKDFKLRRKQTEHKLKVVEQGLEIREERAQHQIPVNEKKLRKSHLELEKMQARVYRVDQRLLEVQNEATNLRAKVREAAVAQGLDPDEVLRQAMRDNELFSYGGTTARSNFGSMRSMKHSQSMRLNDKLTRNGHGASAQSLRRGGGGALVSTSSARSMGSKSSIARRRRRRLRMEEEEDDDEEDEDEDDDEEERRRRRRRRHRRHRKHRDALAGVAATDAIQEETGDEDEEDEDEEEERRRRHRRRRRRRHRHDDDGEEDGGGEGEASDDGEERHRRRRRRRRHRRRHRHDEEDEDDG